MKWLVARVLDPNGSWFSNGRVLSRVEFRTGRMDSPLEKAALVQSVSTHKLTIDIEHSMRACTIVEAPTADEAHRVAEPVIDEALDLLDFENIGLSRNAVLGPGFARSFVDGAVVSRQPSVPFGPFTAYAIQPW